MGYKYAEEKTQENLLKKQAIQGKGRGWGHWSINYAGSFSLLPRFLIGWLKNIMYFYEILIGWYKQSVSKLFQH